MTDLVEPPPGVPAALHRRRAVGYALYLAGALLFAVNGTVSKAILLAGVPTTRLSELRVTAAFLILFIVVAVIRRRALRLHRDEIGMLIAYGVLGLAMTQWLYFVALERLPIGIALILEFTAPIMVALWFRFGRHQAVRSGVWIGLILALVGLAIIARVWQGLTFDVLGVSAAFGAAVALALFYVLGEHQVRRPGGRDVVSLMMWAFGVAALFWAIVQPWWSFPWDILGLSGFPLGETGPAVPVWGLSISMVIFGTVLPFLLVVAAMHHITASEASAVGMTEPVLATAVAWVALSEVLSPAQIVGGFVVLAGVFLAERSR